MESRIRTFPSIAKGGFFDRHPILVPATLFAVCWIPYVVIFFRRTISFGDVGSPYPVESAVYWVLLAVQLLVCVISHSLTIRTIVRLYAPRWLIWGSVAFYALSPAWGAMTAADIRHPLFAAVFCVFVSSSTFILYSKRPPAWLWVQLAGGALAVCLLRAEGAWAVIPTLAFVFMQKGLGWWSLDKGSPLTKRLSMHFSHLGNMAGTLTKREESHWGDVCAAFLVLSAVSLLWFFTWLSGWGLPLGEPDFGSAKAMTGSVHEVAFPFANLTGTGDMAGIIPFADIAGNSIFAEAAMSVANAIFAFQCWPVENITFSWMAYLVLFAAFLAFAICIAAGMASMRKGRVATSPSKGDPVPSIARPHDLRPLILAAPMLAVLAFMAFVPADLTLRYIMPVLAAQPMFFGSCFASLRGDDERNVRES